MSLNPVGNTLLTDRRTITSLSTMRWSINGKALMKVVQNAPPDEGFRVL